MQTPTHLLLAAAGLTRRGERSRNVAVLLGAFAPDLSIYVLFVWSKLAGIPEWRVWREIYWQEPWQTLSAISNSAPLWAVLFGVGLLTHRTWLWVFAAAALLHLALDFPFHHSDAHAHFWPLSDWRFRSPLSYWDPAHHGNTVFWIEIGLAIFCTAVLCFRHKVIWLRVVLVTGLLAYAAVPAYFRMALG